MLLMGYAESPFRDFESYLRSESGLNEEDIQLILEQYNSNFVNYEFSPGIYSIKDFSEVVYTMGVHEETLTIEYDDISMKTKLILKRFGGTVGTFNFDEKSFFSILLSFTPFWDYKPTNAIHADSPGKYTTDKTLNKNTMNKIHLKCKVVDVSMGDEVQEFILFSFKLEKPAGYKIFRRPETIYYKIKINRF